MTRRVLLLATTTGYQTRAFGEAATSLGVELVFATDRCHMIDDPWRDSAVPIRFHEEAASVDAILQASAARPVEGVLVVGDRPAVIAARVLEALGLPGHSPAAAADAGNKIRTRQRFQAAGLAGPWFVPVAVTDDPVRLSEGVEYPCVIKPVALSASRGVMRADDPGMFVATFERLRRLLQSPDIRAERNDAHNFALVEGFIPGREYALEGLMHHGELQVLAIFDKPQPLDGPFFEETIYVTPSLAPAPVQAAIADTMTQAARALGLSHGPVHAECRVNPEGVFPLEVAARPIGGLCARALRFAKSEKGGRGSFSTLEELLLRHALGESPRGWEREPAASGVMMIPVPARGLLRGVDGVDAASQIPGIDEVRITAKTDQLLLPLPEGASYLGFIFAHATEPTAVEQALHQAHGCLRLTIDAELPVLGQHEIHYNQSHG